MPLLLSKLAKTTDFNHETQIYHQFESKTWIQKLMLKAAAKASDSMVL